MQKGLADPAPIPHDPHAPASPRAGLQIPCNIQTEAPDSDGSSAFFYYANSTEPTGADVSTLGSLTQA